MPQKIAKVKYTAEDFTDVKFMTGADKAKVANAWQRLLVSNFGWTQFTKAIYDHLTLHCSHIAHYNRGGFHDEWMNGPAQRARFIADFKAKYESGRFSWGAGSDYIDLQRVLYQHLVEYEAQLVEQARVERIAELEDAKVRTNASIDAELSALRS